MARPRKPIPTPRLHEDRKNGQRAVCDYYDPGSGKRCMAVLGPWGSQEADQSYQRLLADLEAGRLRKPASGITVAELCAQFIGHARSYYRGADGKITSEVHSYALLVACLNAIAGDLAAAAFGPVALQQVRAAMVKRGWSRKYVNSQIERTRRMFRWAVGEELVPVEVWQALTAVRGLGKGRTTAPESEPVQPATAWQVGRTLPHLPDMVAAMVRFQWWCGCRPQDVCQLRAEDLDRTGDTWIYRPVTHKGTWRGQVRSVWIGPRAQAVLLPWLEEAGSRGVVFSPRRAYAARAARPGGRPPGEKYVTASYDRAVSRACEAAGVKAWTPNQLRHAAATRVRERFGLEQAQQVLGHERMTTTEIYAKRSAKLAAEVMRKAG